MNKVILTVAVLTLGFIGFAQDKADTSQRLKYVTTAPDGSVAMTITDDSSKDNLKLESANDFYRFEILDPTTGEAVFVSKNQGKECEIDKTKLTSGTYNLRLYTSNFVITSKIAINNTKKRLPSLQSVGDVVASR
jgi:hypothetical protein